jgi:hypothetical protein
MQYDWSARAGVPSHITLLGPFLPSDRLGSQVVERLRSLFASYQTEHGTAAYAVVVADLVSGPSELLWPHQPKRARLRP